jgi:hypothetical protein
VEDPNGSHQEENGGRHDGAHLEYPKSGAHHDHRGVKTAITSNIAMVRVGA